jgi:ATP-binding cassette, subfamily B (MDR/TAP), member 1
VCLTSRAAQVRIYSHAATIAQDALRSIKTIYACGAQQKIVNSYDEYLQTAHKEGKKKSLIYGVLFSSQTFLVISGTALAFWEGFRLFHSGEIRDIGTVFTVVLSVTLGATSVLFFLPQIGATTNASSAAAELFPLSTSHLCSIHSLPMANELLYVQEKSNSATCTSRILRDLRRQCCRI